MDKATRFSKLSADKQILLRRRIENALQIKDETVIPKRQLNEPSPLSFSQRQIWAIDQMSPGNPAYNLPTGYRIKGALDTVALERSFNEIIKRHETLRTTLAVVGDSPEQIVHSEHSIQVHKMDISGFSNAEKERMVMELASKEATISFDLLKLPLMKVSLFKLSEIEYILIINMHHTITDGWSVGVLLSELDVFYRHCTSGSSIQLPTLTIQYGDYSLWEEENLSTNKYERQLDFWISQLNGNLRALELPCDRQRPNVQSFKGSNVFFDIPLSLSQRVQNLGNSAGCTFFMTMLAAFQVILCRYAGAENFVIGTPVANRTRCELEPLIGNFLNMVPIQADLSENPTFIEVLKRVREITLDAFSNKDLPFEKIVEKLKFDRDPSRNPIFQIMMQVLNTDQLQLGDLDIKNFYFDLNFAQFDLSLHIYEEESGYIARFEYCTDLFNADTIERLSRHLLKLLEEVTTNPGQSISSIPILAERERKMILFDWNQTESSYPEEECLHQLFEEAAGKYADRIAVEFEGRQLTYKEVNENANKLAKYLVKSGVTPESIVGIFVERSPELLIGMLGILKSGASYVPMDPLFPPDRLEYMMEDAGIKILVADEGLIDLLPRSDRKTICVDTQWDEIAKEDASNLNTPVNTNFLAYTIYTSGSTGKPKGVMIEHRSVVNFLVSMQKEPGFKQDETLIAVTTISFDIAVLELFLPVISGGKVVIANRNEVIDGNLLLELIEQTGATAMQATPATWKLMIETGWERTPNLKMMCGGEALPRKLANQMLERGGELWNMYGPTETTIWSSVQKIEPGNEPIFIGPPIANTQFYVVDKEFEPVPIGVAGELLIGGEGLARGYLNRPNLTASRFIDDPFKKGGSRVYRTGDLSRFLANGIVEFLGRLDFQVKVRGFRIELGEIEHQLNQHVDVKEAVVIAQIDERQDVRLAAYIIPAEGKELIGSDLRNYLAQKLPDYMVPSFFIKMDKFPLTPNAKIDRKAFPKPEAALLTAEKKYVAPRDELELQLAGIWQKILKVKVIGINDNFFELGGHSLLAAQMFAHINKKIEMNLPLAILFQAPTIQGLAAFIRRNEWKPSWKSLVPIQVSGNTLPLFLVHGAEGNILLYRNLAYHLGKRQTVYGLQARGLNGEEPIESDLRQMATKYIEEIKSIQPEGPYLIGGYCLGGAIALEMAAQLKNAGDEVASVILIETYNLKDNPKETTFFLRTIHRFQNVYFQFRNIFQSQEGDGRKYLEEKIRTELSRYKISMNIFISEILQKLNPKNNPNYHHLRISKINDKAQEQYQPVVFEGKIMLCRPRTNFYGFNDPFFGWSDFAKEGIQVVNMPNYPRGSLNEPYVKTLAQYIKIEVETTTKKEQDKKAPMVKP